MILARGSNSSAKSALLSLMSPSGPGWQKLTAFGKYEYYSVFQKWSNTNTNSIWFPKNDRIRILFGFPKMVEYEYE